MHGRNGMTIDAGVGEGIGAESRNASVVAKKRDWLGPQKNAWGAESAASADGVYLNVELSAWAGAAA